MRGLISIGTNSTRALVADLSIDPPAALLHRSIGTRIGEGLRERGHLDEKAMQRTLDAIEQHMTAIRALTSDLRVIATSALRRADNEAHFAGRVRELAGCDLQIISGEEEAACSFTGAVSGIASRDGERLGVLDVGGGSSEYAAGEKSGAEHLVSCEIGAVRLTEAIPELAGHGGAVPEDLLERARARAEHALGPALKLPRVQRVALVGGSATTAVSLVRESRERFRYAEISLQQLRAWIARLLQMRLEDRKGLAGMNPQRADILPAGLIIIERFLATSQHSSALVSTNDVLLGYLLRH
jgi:exopolyphosphatase/guanosine-5'-triphosphate,3'-diphosphate pyrophosphatase